MAALLQAWEMVRRERRNGARWHTAIAARPEGANSSTVREQATRLTHRSRGSRFGARTPVTGAANAGRARVDGGVAHVIRRGRDKGSARSLISVCVSASSGRRRLPSLCRFRGDRGLVRACRAGKGMRRAWR
jgi:hypothetical protein